MFIHVLEISKASSFLFSWLNSWFFLTKHSEEVENINFKKDRWKQFGFKHSYMEASSSEIFLQQLNASFNYQ